MAKDKACVRAGVAYDSANDGCHFRVADIIRKPMTTEYTEQRIVSSSVPRHEAEARRICKRIALVKDPFGSEWEMTRDRERSHQTRLYSAKFNCNMVSLTAAKTNRMFSVSVAQVKWE